MRSSVRSLLALIVALNVLGWVPFGAALPEASAADNAAGEDAPAAAPADINVTTYADEWDSDANPASAHTKCSLREALQLAYNNGDRGCGPTAPSASTVNLKLPPGTYTLSYADVLPNVGSGKTIVISGPQASTPALTIDGGSQQSRHLGIFYVVGGQLNLKYVALRHGSRPGGGALMQLGGVVTADHVTFQDNDAASSNDLTQAGGALLTSTGVLTVTNSVFIHNHALGGGGAVSTAFGYFFKTDFIDNEASAGGALLIHTSTTFPVVVVESKFQNNRSRPSPSNDPAPGYTPSGDLNGGGAVFNNGNLRLTKVLMANNRSELSKGGGGLLNQGLAILNECVIANNNAVANGSGDSNSNIKYAWGGGIFNAGDLDLVRCSVHNNQADYAGALFNTLPGDAEILNTTVTNNTVREAYGGVMNEHTLFNNAVAPGAEIHLYHATLGQNGVPLDSSLQALYDRSVRFGNSILDGPCNVLQYTVGRSVMTGFCDTIPDPTIDLFASADLSGTSQFQLGLQGLTGGNSSVPQFMVQPIDGGSVAVDIGRNGQYGCDNPDIHRVDQNNKGRGPLCDAGAYEAAQQPPQFGSTPAPGRIDFPVVDFSKGQGGSLVDLVIRNTGGGAFDYTVVDQSPAGNSGVTLESSPTGTLFRNGQATLTFHCAPPGDGDHWKVIDIVTDPTLGQPRFVFKCTGVNQNPVASLSQPPGPVNMPSMPLGATTHSTLVMSNPAHDPLGVTYGLRQNNGVIGLMPVAAQAPAAPQGPAQTLAPGQALSLDVSCTPLSYGLFQDTLVFTTTDPLQPHIEYNLACGALVDSPPEALSPAGAYVSAANFEAVAVSPDGTQVLGGAYSDTLVRLFNRNAASGALTANGVIGTAGLSQIYGIQYSHDGHNVYYTSQAGDGVVTLNRSNNVLSVSQVITTGTRYACPTPPLFFCTIGTLNGARGLAVSPDDQYVYVAGHGDGTLTVLRRATDGSLAFAQAITRTLGGVNVLGGAARVATSPDGLHIYVAAITDNSLAVFQREDNGHLDFQAAYKDGAGGLTSLGSPSDLALSPDGQFVYVSGFADNALNIFRRGPADGLLSLTNVITGVTGAYGVAVTSDDAGERLFLAQFSANQLKVYARDPLSGTLSPLGTYSQITPTSNLLGPVFIAVSPDNKDVYTSLFAGQAVRHFQTARNAPVLTQISPASAAAGDAAFELTVVGGRFYPNSKIVWGAQVLTTEYVSEHELRAPISAGLVSAPGSVSVIVRNTAPGGGDTAAQTFAITDPSVTPTPSIEATVPAELSAGDDDVLVYVQGANFAPDAQVYYNLIPVPTLYLNDQVLQITVWATLLEQPGTAGLQVVNGGGTPALTAPDGPAAPAAAVKRSTVAAFRVVQAGRSAQPALTSLVPSSALSGTAPLWITVSGRNFSSDARGLSVGRWNGQARPSVVVDAQTLLMQLTAADLSVPGNALVTVQTPRAGDSPALAFRVRLPGEKPVPGLTSVVLNGWTVVVNGSDFAPGAAIRVNGTPRATTYVNGDQLKMTIGPGDRGGLVTVFNSGPGGGLSNGLAAFFGNLFLPSLRR